MDTLVAAIRKFNVLNQEELSEIPRYFRVSHIPKRRFFLQVGQIAPQLCFVKKGLLRNFVKKNDTTEIVNSFSEELTFNLVNVSFLTQTPSSEYIQALEDTELLTIDYKNMQKLYSHHHGWERIGRLLLESAVIEQNLRIRSFLEETAQMRYEKFMQRYPGLLHRTHQYHIASYLGITPESLSRLRKHIYIQ
ncbi:cAMP-binding domain of CRP or a regulatory subunit of cAMP-dependent protein kinases [Pseudarcicella hirudinis]|uniref:cAMP-binding domain of CRP or a regulatory subunit of cAMP-dependent protein kinases n=1 Tax=Pseudarcicella hirudinis TaxID=1079859 RepID=A0A1I5SSZ1_9BACT|nr:Crp/Fnr family transcriptional regulator [Pseudarcicella hirudinis]SFP73751.1 cAMP-binding domain of CRP or a regulatory subunit of cAMP-dependent protein kinases [Pseudarcicella hirudinis]